MQYNHPNGNNLQYSTIVIKNLRWSGFLCAAKVSVLKYLL